MEALITEPREMETAAGDPPDEPIRVLWLIKGLGRGGAEMLLLNAARLRDRDAFDCHAGYILGSRSWLAEDLREAGVPVHLFASESPLDLRWALELRRFLMRSRFDVVHVHSPYVAAIARIVARSLPRGLRPRTMSTEHLPWAGHRAASRLMNAATFVLDDAHVAVSDAVLRSIPPRLRRDVLVLVHGVPVDLVRSRLGEREAVRRELGISPGEMLVGSVANYTVKKAHSELVEAARILVDRRRQVRFAVAGRGPLEAEIRARATRLGLGDRFLVLGPVEDAPRFMAACDLFALASHHEGLPLVVMEALALGLPVVATAVGGVPQLVRHGTDGLLVPPGNPRGLADALDALLIDGARRAAMSMAAAEGAHRFDNRRAVRAIEDLYRRVARNHRRADRSTRRGGRG